MNQTELNKYKAMLEARQAEISAGLRNREDIAIEKTAEEMDEIQRGSDRVLALDSITRMWETSTLVTEALKRIDDNTYGICLECEEPISARRLAALPWARYCISCQDARDRANADLR